MKAYLPCRETPGRGEAGLSVGYHVIVMILGVSVASHKPEQPGRHLLSKLLVVIQG